MIEQRTLPPEPASASAARRFTQEVLSDWQEGDLSEIVALLVSELVTNAVLHAASPVDVALRRRGPAVRVEVADTSPVIPGAREFGDDATTGRGLALIDALSEDWGVDTIPQDGKVVWFEVLSATGTVAEELEPLDATITLPDDEVVIRLLSAPVQLFPAAQQHMEALLREFALMAISYNVAGQGPPHLPVDMRAVQAQLHAAVESGKATTTLVVAAPASAHDAIEYAREALDVADRLAAEGQLLTAPALPEVRWCREWFLHQVQSQLDGEDPIPWEMAGIRTDRKSALEIDAKLILDHLHQPIVVADDQNHIAYVNHATEKLLGWPEGQLEGARLTTIIPERLHEAHIAGYSRFLVTRQGRLLGKPVRVPAVRCDGSEVDIELTITAVASEGASYVFVAILRDVSSEEPNPPAPRNAILDAVVKQLGDGRRVDNRRDVPHLLSTIAAPLGWKIAAWWRIENAELQCHGVWTEDPDRFARFATVTKGHRFAYGSGLPGRAWAAEQPVWIPDVVQEANFPRLSVALETGLRSACVVPLLAGSDVVGVIEMFNDQVQPTDLGMIASLETVAQLLGMSHQPEPGS